MSRIWRFLRDRFAAGLLVVVPVVATFLVLRVLFQSIDSLLGPPVSRLLGHRIPGLGVMLTVGLVFLVGLVATSIAGRRLIAFGDRLLHSLPLVRRIYKVSKEIVGAFTLTDRRAYQDVVMIEYPRKGLYAYGFQTGTTTRVGPEGPEEWVHVFLPSPPVPTSGALIAVRATEVLRIGVTPEEALKLILSAGMVTPPRIAPREEKPLPEAPPRG